MTLFQTLSQSKVCPLMYNFSVHERRHFSKIIGIEARGGGGREVAARVEMGETYFFSRLLEKILQFS